MRKKTLSLFFIVAALSVLSAPILVHAPPADTNPPTIGTPVITPSSPSAPDPVTIMVNVTDDRSGVNNVTIVYTTNNWQTVNVTLLASYNLTTTTASAQIPPLTTGGHVAFYIVAFDNQGNRQVNDKLGTYFGYDVTAPPFTSVTSNWIIVAMLAGVAAVVAFASLKIIRKRPQSTSRQPY